MSLRTILIVFLALVCGLAAVYGVSLLPQLRPEAAAAERGDLVPVVVALADIPRGTTVSAEQLKVEDRPKAEVPAGALSKVADVSDRVVAFPLVKNEASLSSSNLKCPRKLMPNSGSALIASSPSTAHSTFSTSNLPTRTRGMILRCPSITRYSLRRPDVVRDRGAHPQYGHEHADGRGEQHEGMPQFPGAASHAGHGRLGKP